jgi:hypothetical protein
MNHNKHDEDHQNQPSQEIATVCRHFLGSHDRSQIQREDASSNFKVSPRLLIYDHSLLLL